MAVVTTDGIIERRERNGDRSHVRWFDFVRPFPNLAQAHGGMEPVENGQRHGHVRDDSPGPQAIEVELNGMGIGPGLLQRIDGPHGQVTD